MITIETPETFAKNMAEIANMLENPEGFSGWSIDQEEAHIMADGLMCDLLQELGYGEGVDIFLKIPKWYA